MRARRKWMCILWNHFCRKMPRHVMQTGRKIPPRDTLAPIKFRTQSAKNHAHVLVVHDFAQIQSAAKLVVPARCSRNLVSVAVNLQTQTQGQ